MSQSDAMPDILKQTWNAHVFGSESFGTISDSTKLAVIQRIGGVAAAFDERMTGYLAQALPEAPEQFRKALVHGLRSKTAGFTGALTLDEIEPQNVSLLVEEAVAVGGMYFFDQGMDRNWPDYVRAVEWLDRTVPTTAAHFRPSVLRLTGVVPIMGASLARLCRPEDLAIVRGRFFNDVLVNELRTYRLGQQYQDYMGTKELSRAQQAQRTEEFMREHGEELARLMIVSAGFPSVQDSLTSIYGKQDPSVPSLQETYHEPHLERLSWVNNGVVRAEDDRGDIPDDRGDLPGRGVFNHNLFNQAAPSLIRPYLRMTGIVDPATCRDLEEALMTFHDSPESQAVNGGFVIDTLLDHARQQTVDVPRKIAQRYHRFITNGKRVHEIGYVNMVGDLELERNRSQ